MRKFIFTAIIIASPFLCIKAQEDTTTTQDIVSWSLSDFSKPKPTSLDTVWFKLHKFNPTVGNLYLSSYGTPIKYQLVPETVYSPFPFKQHFLDYLHSNKETQYFRTTTPFTFFNYNSGGGSDKISEVNGFHTQNVNENFNFGFKVKTISSSRFYEPDDEKTVRSFFFSLFGSYNSNNYDAYFNIHSNTIRNKEIGGIQNKDEFENGVQEIFTRNLTGANSVLKNRTLYFSQKLALSGRLTEMIKKVSSDTLSNDTLNVLKDSIKQANKDIDTTRSNTKYQFFSEDSAKNQWSLLHTLQYGSDNYKYLDENPLSAFYTNYPINIDSSQTNDNTEFTSLTNDLYLHFSSTSTQFKVGMIHDLQRYSLLRRSNPLDTLVKRSDVKYRYFNNLELHSAIQIDHFSNMLLKGSAGYFLTGYNQGDYHFDIGLQRMIDSNTLSLAAAYELTNPNFYYQTYNSNHFQWNNSFDKTKTLEAHLSYAMPDFGLRLKVHGGLIEDYVFLDEQATPSQYQSPLAFAVASFHYDIKFWKFHLSNNIYYQYTDNYTIYNVPEFYIKESLAFRHVFHFNMTGGKLYTQLGINMYYYPEYYADAYMPALNLFYNQYDQTIGGKPIVNVFANLKIKRTSLFIKLFHANSPLQTRDYYSAPNYPMSPFMLKFGVFWSFYD